MPTLVEVLAKAKAEKEKANGLAQNTSVSPVNGSNSEVAGTTQNLGTEQHGLGDNKSQPRKWGNWGSGNLQQTIQNIQASKTDNNSQPQTITQTPKPQEQEIVLSLGDDNIDETVISALAEFEEAEAERGFEKEDEITAEEYNHPSQPDGLSEEAVREFEGCISMLRANFEDPQMVANAIANTVALINQHPFLKDNIKDEDFGIMVQSLRMNYTKIAISKGEKKAKKEINQAKVAETMHKLTTFGWS